MESVALWRQSPHALHLRRQGPDVYTDKATMISLLLARVNALNALTLDEGDLPQVQMDVPALVVHRRRIPKAILNAHMYASDSVASNPLLFIYDDKLYSFEYEAGVAATYVAVLATTSDHQDFMFIAISDKGQFAQISIVRDIEELPVNRAVFRDTARLDEYDHELVPLVDGSANDLRWHYDLISEMVSSDPNHWIGVRCPLRVRAASGFVDDTIEGSLLTTHIQLPYVHMKLMFQPPQPLPFDDVLIVVETKRGARSVLCELPAEGISIGVPATGDRNGLIARMHVTDSALTRVDVLAVDFPFRTPLSGASTLATFASSFFAQLADDDELNIAGALERDERKTWIEPDVEEHPPSIGTKIGCEWPAHTGLENFVLRYRSARTSQLPPSWHGDSVLVIDAGEIVLPAKDKVRLHVSYVLDGRTHKHRLKLKTPRVVDGERAYFFELPGPLHLRLVATPRGQDSFAVSTLVVDTQRTQLSAPSSPLLLTSSTSDDEDWAALL